jgi:hypothetical protein
MPTLNLRKRSANSAPEFTDHFIRHSVNGRSVTFQVLPVALEILKNQFPRVNFWNLPEEGLSISTELVIKLRTQGHLFTKRELQQQVGNEQQRRCRW